jgi:hypothetical protein
MGHLAPSPATSVLGIQLVPDLGDGPRAEQPNRSGTSAGLYVLPRGQDMNYAVQRYAELGSNAARS